MQTDEILSKLRAAGIHISGDEERLSLGRRQERAPVIVETAIKVAPERPNPARDQQTEDDVQLMESLEPYDYIDSCRIWRSDQNHNRWIYSNWQYMPGPGPTDIELEADTFEKALWPAFDYYLGTSILIGGWNIPLHQHPEWTLDRLTKIIGTAAIITTQAWNEIRKQDRILFDARDFYTMTSIEKYAFTFIEVFNKDGQTLQLGRDLERAYIVQD